MEAKLLKRWQIKLLPKLAVPGDNRHMITSTETATNQFGVRLRIWQRDNTIKIVQKFFPNDAARDAYIIKTAEKANYYGVESYSDPRSEVK